MQNWSQIVITKCLLFDFLFVSGSGFEPDGGADEAEGFADLIGEEAFEGEVEFDSPSRPVAAREQNWAARRVGAGLGVTHAA